MFTSLTETNPASEYQNPPSRSSIFNGFSINDDRYLVSRILAGFEVILRKSNSELIEQITSAYADRDTDTLSNGGECDRRFANKESDAIAHQIANHTVAIASRSHLRLLETSFRLSNLVSHHQCIQSSHVNSHSTIPIAFVCSNSPIPESAPARKHLKCDRLTDI